MLSDDGLKEIEERAKAFDVLQDVYPGRKWWKARVCEDPDDSSKGWVEVSHACGIAPDEELAEAFESAPTDIAELLNEVRRLRVENAELTEQNEAMDYQIRGEFA